MYMFQLFSIILWFVDEYFYYTCSVTFMMVLTLSMGFYEIITDDTGIDKMADDE